MLTPNALHDCATRFAADLEALTGRNAAHRFGLAISGGPDSVAMLVLADAAFSDRIAAATIDHGLRSTSAEEARFVARLCAARAIPHTIIRLEGMRRGNVSDASREARYAALHGWVESAGLDWLLTAHHADDQLETLVMRLNRGSGVAGLAGVRRRRGRIVRPLLGWRHEELAAVAAASGIAAIDDPSNRDDRYDRARLRKTLADTDWIDRVAASASASALADADDALDWMVLQLRAERLSASIEGIWSYDARDLPHELRRRALLDCLRVIDPGAAPRGAGIDRVLATLAAGKTATIGQVRCTISPGGSEWCFARAAPRRTG